MSRKFEGMTLSDMFKRQRNGCWIWQGHVKKYKGKRTPIWKGWYSAKESVYEWLNGTGSLRGKLIRGTTCGNSICVNPEHQKVIRRINGIKH